MEKYSGKSIYKGIAIGRILFYGKKAAVIKRYKVEDPQAEIERYERAKKAAVSQLNKLYETAVLKVGEENAAIFEVHAMLLEDDDFNDSIRNMIMTQQINAEYAAAATGENFSNLFAQMEDEYFRARSADIKDISERVVSILSGKEQGRKFDESVIVAADDLMPSETVQMDKEKVLAFATRLGSSNSHTAILARTMNIPALTGIPVMPEWDGRLAIVDGHSGTLILDPDEESLAEMKQRQENDREVRRLLQELKGKENITLDGKKISVYANIGSLADVGTVLSNDGGGIGLFRSEFIYLGKSSLPTEEEQFQIYKSVAEMMAGKKVIIRTLDIGADKQADYLGLEKEDNPAMGFRAIRICLSRPEIFRTQLRAVYRASAFGNISVMYPMITSVEEVKKILRIVENVKNELTESGIPWGEVEQGIMIETPAAALISDLLAKEVDFFSIGTNDLTQYTLAMDRQNSKLDEFYNPHHEAVLRLIEQVVRNGHREGCWVGICGELGADLELTERFLRMGIDELSVAPGMILAVRKQIRNSTAGI
ncbi:phosphoenolpyruvate--protein phosphotransferase [Wansuia hejianensis]|uniref:Phosphoenolpyruvate-protein phosphotransferase n=1 Tax=Wansuia hejianensis TaxID=2763667 RepID=A0A7G9GHM4_9FIRM|nr:phosphoenolpyruvate--protein phosphotransferase [Wansuia hejianensis]QNM10306.1 phosphoenolpyruvate--protein phosphotransferase [Wansuia hejianensis]RHV91527.1 phosphoenolpyruvate--protein phosphotransferase [Lachnospiraceae bacterium OF09-33XD]